MSKGNFVYLHTGTNLGNRLQNLAKANEYIAAHIGKIEAVSSVYETEAWGVTNQPKFYNQALKVLTILNPIEVLKKALWIESNFFNRERGEKWAARIIDIDVLLYEDRIIETNDLVLPHPHLHQRNFVLIPLMEIAGEVEHPKFKKTIDELYWESEDTLEVYTLEK
jgi:2-amino-4-hydroxy-6-hydroxymethyldihydropteridine diphosphokinase